jgi:Lar family restriction alleviation protein
MGGNEKKMAELKPCPFCGWQVIDVCNEGQLFGKSAYARNYVFVRCRKCYARTGVYGTKPKAVAEWNRRAGDGK